MNYHYGIAQALTCIYSSLLSFIHDLNKCFSHYETPITINTLSHYLFSRSIDSNRSYVHTPFKIVLSLLDLSLTPLQLYHEFQTSLPLTKH
jgi:hypothetical protein